MGVEPGGEPALELVIEPRSDRFDADDDRWRRQAAELYTQLGREVDGLRRQQVAVPGTKGGAETVILALGSAGAFTAAVEFLRAWLGRDRSRSLDVSWTVDGRTETVTLRGEAIDQSAVAAIAQAAAARIGGTPWTPPTAPS